MVLFVLTVIGIVLYKSLKGVGFYIGWFVVWLVFYILPDVWVFNQIEFLLPFYVMGIMGRNVKWESMNIIATVFAFVGFCACFSIFTFDDTMYSMGSDCFSYHYVYGTLLRLFSGIFGILCSVALVKFLIKVSDKVKWLSAIGTMTLPIYVLHQKLFLANKVIFFHTDHFLLLILLTLIVIFITIGAYKLLRRNKYIALLLFGEVQSK